jgi:hypothetical protein
MRIGLAWLVVGMIACATSKPPPADPSPTFVCGHLGHGVLFVFQASADAIETAQAEYDTAAAIVDDPARAAQHYLACAAAYRSIPDNFAEIEHVVANTRQCYQAAIIEYYNGQILDSQGRAAVTAALAGETRGDGTLKADVSAELAAQKECGAE